MPRGKRYREAAAKIEAEKLYDPAAAADLAAETSPSKFDATVEAHIRLGVDAKQSEQNVRGNVPLPHGTGKKLRIAVFAQGEKAKEAMDAGADIVGGEDLVKQVTDGQIDFDVAIATPDAMGMVGKIGKVLGPRGLMPNPKSGTVTFDIARAVKDVKAGRVEFRIDKFGIVHAPIGKVSFGGSKLQDNFAALMEAIVKAKPTDSKGTFVKTVTLATTQGPGIKVDPAAAAKLST